jgi:hypothetical protein
MEFTLNIVYCLHLQYKTVNSFSYLINFCFNNMTWLEHLTKLQFPCLFSNEYDRFYATKKLLHISMSVFWLLPVQVWTWSPSAACRVTWLYFVKCFDRSFRLKGFFTENLLTCSPSTLPSPLGAIYLSLQEQLKFEEHRVRKSRMPLGAAIVKKMAHKFQYSYLNSRNTGWENQEYL